MTNGTYNIDVRSIGGLTATQGAAFASAAERWSQIIIADLPSVTIGGQLIDDVAIDAGGSRIDGPAGILGRAGPTYLRPGSLLPAKGVMEFDTGDLERMEKDGSLEDVILHEMGHVLGIGTLWERMGLLEGAGTANPRFTGANAMREFAALIGSDTPTPVPVENRGGVGTREGHWREAVLANELMTGFLNVGPNPLSRVTAGALQDLGYQVNLTAAEDFELPSFLQLAIMGIGAIEHPQGCMMAGTQRRGAEPEVLPEDAIV